MNFLPAELTRRDGALVARADGATLPVAPDLAARLPGNGAAHPVTLGVRPEHVDIRPVNGSAVSAGSDNGAATSGAHAVGEVYVVEPMGREQVVDVRLGERSLQAIAPVGLPLEIGDRVALRFDPARLHLFDPTAGTRLA